MAKWNIDPTHTNVGFSVRHMMFSKVRGRFTNVTGSLEGDPQDLANASIQVDIDVASIHTNNEDRDNHLRSEDFFQAEKYPSITFASKEIKETGENKFAITVLMTMKDTTKEVTLTGEYLGSGTNTFGVDDEAFEVSVKISREEFGMTWNQAIETGGVLVGDDITLELSVQVNPAQ